MSDPPKFPIPDDIRRLFPPGFDPENESHWPLLSEMVDKELLRRARLEAPSAYGLVNGSAGWFGGRLLRLVSCSVIRFPCWVVGWVVGRLLACFVVLALVLPLWVRTSNPRLVNLCFSHFLRLESFVFYLFLIRSSPNKRYNNRETYYFCNCYYESS